MESVRDFEKSITADNAIAQYTVVKVTSTGCDTATADTDKIIGICQNAPAASEQAVIRFAGTSKLVSSGSIAVGDRVTATTGGKGVTTTTDKKVIVGMALQVGTTSGDICEVLLTPGVTTSL